MVAVGLAVVFAYALGTFPTGLLVASREGHNVLEQGSGNPGASNVYRVAGFRAGAVVLIGDALKGALAAGVGRGLGGPVAGLIVGLAAVVGHCFPIQRWGRGGKGVATAGGVGVVVFPYLAVALTVIWFLIARVLNKASLGSLAVLLAAPVVVAGLGRPAKEIALLTALCLLVLARHHANIRRLIKGEEGSLRSPA
ncbi:MAG: acyl phosphate:glycerol-3-phosphate acyltransferase [Actinomycetota bacterium]